MHKLRTKNINGILVFKKKRQNTVKVNKEIKSIKLDREREQCDVTVTSKKHINHNYA